MKQKQTKDVVKVSDELKVNLFNQIIKLVEIWKADTGDCFNDEWLIDNIVNVVLQGIE